MAQHASDAPSLLSLAVERPDSTVLCAASQAHADSSAVHHAVVVPQLSFRIEIGIVVASAASYEATMARSRAVCWLLGVGLLYWSTLPASAPRHRKDLISRDASEKDCDHASVSDHASTLAW